MLKNLKPIVIENSRVPAFLSKFAPIQIGAISILFFVFVRDEINDITRRHETIHFQQQLELLFIGQWLLYVYYLIRNYIKLKDSKMAYYLNPFELEAYIGADAAAEPGYLKTRKRYSSWWSFRNQYKTGGHSKK